MKHWARQIDRWVVLFMAVSFLGWLAETLFFLLCYGRFCDRGFLTLPFCTIYGCSFLLLYALLGVPGPNGRTPLAVYTCVSALLVTLLELVTGVLFQHALHLRLWDYSAYPFHFHGYICLEYTLLWGLLLPPCMRWVFVPLKKRLSALSPGCLRVLSVTLILASTLDWWSHFSRLLRN